MSYCCSQCGFKCKFDSALSMHRQLHHGASPTRNRSLLRKFISRDVPPARQCHSDEPFRIYKEDKDIKLHARSSSTTRLFGKLKARLCRSKMLFSHPEEVVDETNIVRLQNECPTKINVLETTETIETPRENHNEIFSCHLCNFDTDRITVLDRHLLNDHKIGIDNLLKLVMAKTTDALSKNNTVELYKIRQSYYKPPDEIATEGEIVIETVEPKVKILKHASVNTDLKWTDIPKLEDCKKIRKEIEEVVDVPKGGTDNERVLTKMQTLNEYMSKFMNSSKTLNKVLAKEFSHKNLVRPGNRAYYDLGLSDPGSPREHPFIKGYEKSSSRSPENRGDKEYTSDSFYF